MKILLSFLCLLLGYSWAACPVGSDPITATDAEDPNAYCLVVVTNKNDNYERAQRKCWNSETGRLSRLGNAYDNNLALYKAAAASNQQTFFYFGLTYSNGSWKYADDELSDLPVTFTKWAPGEPSNPASRSCAVLSVVDQMWYSMECSMELPYLCDIPAIHENPSFCTDGINADVFFMIDNSGNQNDTSMMHDVLFGFNSVLPSQWYSPSSCGDADLKRQQIRLSGVVYYDNTYLRVGTPNFCADNFIDMVDAMQNKIKKQPIITDMSVAIDVAKVYTERQPCACRRTNSTYKTKQIMIWIPMRDEYNTSRPISLSELSSWEHYLLDIRVNKATAKFPLWKDPLMNDVSLPGPWPEFIPTQILRLWRLLCNLTGAVGDTPLPPLV